jgi:hypothetical protein
MWEHEPPDQASSHSSSQSSSRAAGPRGPHGARSEDDATHEARVDAEADVKLRFPGAPPFSDTDDDDAMGNEPDEIESPPYGDLRDEMWLRLRARRVIREFLRSVPRSESEAALAFLAPSGQMRLVTRGELTQAIDDFRPRMRQIIRLNIEEGWPRSKVCAYLHDISMKTFERDQMEGLDLLSEL